MGSVSFPPSSTPSFLPHLLPWPLHSLHVFFFQCRASSAAAAELLLAASRVDSVVMSLPPRWQHHWAPLPSFLPSPVGRWVLVYSVGEWGVTRGVSSPSVCHLSTPQQSSPRTKITTKASKNMEKIDSTDWTRRWFYSPANSRAQAFVSLCAAKKRPTQESGAMHENNSSSSM